MMTAGITWGDNVAEELAPLLDQADRSGVGSLDPEDAARALILIARSEQLGGQSLSTLLARTEGHLAGLAARAPVEDPQALLEALDDLLDAVDDPHGPLHDALLDLDDWLSVAALLDRRGVPAPTAINRGARARCGELAVARIALSPEPAAALAGFALARISGLGPDADTVASGPWSTIAALWQGVADAALQAIAQHAPVVAPAATAEVDAAVRDLLAAFPTTATTPARLRRLLDRISLALVAPRPLAHARSGVDLGPSWFEIAEVGGSVLELAVGKDARNPILQLRGLTSAMPPVATRDDGPLPFLFDEFDAWIADARPGLHRITVDGETVEFSIDQ